MKPLAMNLVRSFAVLVATVFLFASAPDAHANPKYASIVLDMDSGTVLHSSRADKKLYPASLTKMMTLYMAFEAIQTGKLYLDQQLPVSREAARQRWFSPKRSAGRLRILLRCRLQERARWEWPARPSRTRTV